MRISRVQIKNYPLGYVNIKKIEKLGRSITGQDVLIWLVVTAVVGMV